MSSQQYSATLCSLWPPARALVGMLARAISSGRLQPIIIRFCMFRAVSGFSIEKQWDCARKRLRGFDTAKANGTCRGHLLNIQRVRCSNHPLELTYFRQANKSDFAISHIIPRSIVELLQCEGQCCSSH